MIKKGHLLRKTGFYRTINLLPSDGSIIKLREFFAKLMRFDNYNTFLRVKSELLKKRIIEIDYNQRHIRLTRNGVVLKLRLKEIINQIEKGDDK